MNNQPVWQLISQLYSTVIIIKAASTISSHRSEHVHFITLLKLRRWQSWVGAYTKQSGKKQNTKRTFGFILVRKLLQWLSVTRTNLFTFLQKVARSFWSQCMFTAWLSTRLTGLQTTSTRLFLIKKIELQCTIDMYIIFQLHCTLLAYL